jgi:DNA mismatch repair protein MutL
MQSLNTQKIQLLPEHIIDQIKAGEVIERPANIIKEIVENSIDAQSTKIKIHIINNGLDLISIEDDGEGIEFDELPYAFLRHATSKIKKFDDIYQLSSFGFRGEALASISSISKITCKSKTKSTSGQIIIEGSLPISHSKESTLMNTGTSFFIKDLFFNTPARLKFIQSKVSEKNRLMKMINSFILSNHKIEFSYKWDDLERTIYPKEDILKNRIQRVFFKNKQDEVIHVENQYENYHVSLYFSRWSSRGNSNKQQYIFINNRYVIDKKIHNVIINNTQGLWQFGEHGHYCIFLNLPANEIDVNVHPNKTMIKFFMPAIVFSLIGSTMKAQLKQYLEDNKITITSDKQQQPDFNTYMAQSTSSQGTDYNFKDLKSNQSAGNFLDRVEQQISSPHGQLLSEQQIQIPITKICEGYYLYQENQLSFILSENSLFNKFVQLKFKHEIQAAPLLISSPINIEHGKIDKQIDLLEQIGFACDRLDPKTIALRSIPEFISLLDYNKWVEDFFINISKSNSIKTKSDLIQLLGKTILNFKWFNFSLPSLLSLLNEFNSFMLKDEKVLVPLTAKHLAKIIIDYENK